MDSRPTLVSDVRDRILNGDFSAWTDDNPDSWNVFDESAPDPEISEVGAGEGHGGTGNGYCNIYTSDGSSIWMEQSVPLIVGKRYLLSVKVDTVISGRLKLYDRDQIMFTEISLAEVKTYTTTFIATQVTLPLRIARKFAAAVDVTIDNVSVKPIRNKLLW